MPEQFGEKTQEPTPYRRQKAREQGQVARSQDLTSAVLLAGGLLAIMYLGGSIADFFGEYAARHLGSAPVMTADLHLATGEWNDAMHGLSRTVLPLLAVLMIVGVAINIAQVGFLFVPQKLMPDPNHINPAKGIQRIFSLTGLMRLVFGVFKVLVIVVVAGWSVWGYRNVIEGLPEMDILQLAGFIVEIVIWTCLKIAGALLVLALLDYAYQRWKHEKDLRMTTQEIREEMKMLQGDPQIAARRRVVQRQLAMNRLSGTVPQADVVVTNPTELAIAIRYDPQNTDAPTVLAKGAGVIAQRIRRLALENEIPIIERKDLAQFLYKNIEINHPIPPEQYAAVAEVLRYVYELKGKTLPAASQAA